MLDWGVTLMGCLLVHCFYADDVPSLESINHMLQICEQYKIIFCLISKELTYIAS